MTPDTCTTRVIYRRYKAGDVIALLMDVPANPGHIGCYQHIGQHGEGVYWMIVAETRLATPQEYATLHKELTRIGYRLIIRKRRSGQTVQRARVRQAEAVQP